jgi:hypothetical protein
MNHVPQLEASDMNGREMTLSTFRYAAPSDDPTGFSVHAARFSRALRLLAFLKAAVCGLFLPLTRRNSAVDHLSIDRSADDGLNPHRFVVKRGSAAPPTP